jgi:hypothetical protein
MRVKRKGTFSGRYDLSCDTQKSCVVSINVFDRCYTYVSEIDMQCAPCELVNKDIGPMSIAQSDDMTDKALGQLAGHIWISFRKTHCQRLEFAQNSSAV